jgi:hypothetical protein
MPGIPLWNQALREDLMRSYLLIVGWLMLGASVAPAQDNVQTQQVGSDVFFAGALDGQRVSGIAQQIGNTLYYNVIVEGKPYAWTQPVLGATAGRISFPRFSLSPAGVLYVTHAVGDVEYRYGSNGCADVVRNGAGERQTTGNCGRTVASADR